MIVDWILAGIALIGAVLALGKYRYTSKKIEDAEKAVVTHTCLCTQCALFSPKNEKEEK